MKPIPRSLMASSMTVAEPVTGDWGGTYATATKDKPLPVISPVRYEAAAALQRSGYVLSEGTTGLVWVDAVNSDGAYEVPEGSLLTIDGKDKVAVKVSRYCDFGNHIHHWEIEVK